MLPCCHIIAYWESDFLNRNNRNLATFLHLESKLCGKFQCFDASDGWKYWNTKKWLKFQKFQLKWKILKHFTSPKQWYAWKKLFSSPADKKLSTSLFLRTKIFGQRFTRICRHLFSKRSGTAVTGRLKMMQCKCFFWH